MATSREPRWTIPPDPDSARPTSRPLSAGPNPRLRGDAVRIAHSHTGTVGVLFSDTPYVPGKGKTTKNFMLENMRRIKQTQKTNQERKQNEENRPTKPMYKMERFVATATSKVAKIIQDPPPAPRSTSATFLRSHSGKGIPSHLKENRSQSTIGPLVVNATKLSVPKAKECNKQFQQVRKDINYLNRNVREAINTKVRKSPSTESVKEHLDKKNQDEKSHPKGKIPKYLTKRQEQWRRDEERRLASIPDPNMPPGHTLMPDAERRETLAALFENQRELAMKLAKMPLRCDSYTAMNRKTQVERKLAEIDEAIKIFSRPKVYIKED
ncbi:uncharacterized protein TRIADDRAFT_59897 [Trichoplax adhaerens]|uniref:Enkurin domain-containing protein n=1 Tax=Trichoplax adhaerens TaxID=10228 RepID=B3S6R3_TRIAD|nr:hypothetical protein TRIADDRAFT_59897 [Trichoplax adhaerens]EDV21805.1 hypothetical protein TRIADDRAFT_59897 [Trichoplax adhaerens]|eukprot:XP_002115953.1 hypothetical protein TRIADDRAFT_59897 [Trichoplax adhaerens]